MIARVLGVILGGLVVFPLYRLLLDPRTGLAGSDAALAAGVARELLIYGSVLTVAAGVVVARLASPGRFPAIAAAAGRILTRPRPLAFALIAAVFCGSATLAFSLLVLKGSPNLVDAMVQLLQARYVAAGQLAAPANYWGEFWHVQNSVVTERGWVSQYPPGFTLLLAAGFAAGAPWVVGPLLAAVTVFFTALAAERLLPMERATARLGIVLLATSPFFIGLAGAYMNHVAAAAFTAVATYCAIRARFGGGWFWSLAVGVALGAVAAIRPAAAVVCALVVATVWLAAVHPDESSSGLTSGLGKRLGRPGPRAWFWAAGGAAVIGVLLGLYNYNFFGHPLTFGYEYAQGPSVRPGFHLDPWGNTYGLREAIAYTSSDLTTLSLNLVETPIPLVLVVAAYLLTKPRPGFGRQVIVMWALAPVALNALYWHHGVFMGPRMLSEAAPAWAILAAISAVGLVTAIPRRLELRGYNARDASCAILMLGYAAALLYLGPERLVRFSGYMVSSRIEAPQTSSPSLVFVHGGWTSRIAMRLAAHGMSLDSVETALRENATCDVHRYANAYVESRGAVGAEIPRRVSLDLTPTPGSRKRLVTVSKGNQIRVDEASSITGDCAREMLADRFGVVDVSPFLWRGDLPGLKERGAMLVRDYGPSLNAELIRRYPQRTPYLFYRPGEDQPPVLAPHAAGMALLWGGTRPESVSKAPADRMGSGVLQEP